MMKARMKRVVGILLPILIVIGLVGLFWFLIDGKQIDVLQPKGEVATAQRDLFIFTTALSLFVVIPVFVLLGYFSIKYRADNKNAKYMPDWSENKFLELLWWGIPIVIIGVLGVVIYQTSHSLDPYKERAGGDPLKVQVIALRWKWLFIYPEQQIATLNYMPLPTDRPVTFDLSADAPMSAFWIPALGSQIYAMNGMTSKLNLKATEPGTYTGYTTNINGEGYAKMTFNTNVMNESKFSSWVKDAKESDKAMTMQAYNELSKPESVRAERTYTLDDTNLYSMISAKYGHSHSHRGGH